MGAVSLTAVSAALRGDGANGVGGGGGALGAPGFFNFFFASTNVGLTTLRHACGGGASGMRGGSAGGCTGDAAS